MASSTEEELQNFKGIPNGSFFVGDNHDEKVVSRLRDREFEFINYKKAEM